MIKAVESRDRHHSEIGRGELPTPMLEGYRAVIYEQKTGKCAESFSHGLHRQTSTSLNCLRFSAVDRAWRSEAKFEAVMEYADRIKELAKNEHLSLELARASHLVSCSPFDAHLRKKGF